MFQKALGFLVSIYPFKIATILLSFPYSSKPTYNNRL